MNCLYRCCTAAGRGLPLIMLLCCTLSMNLHAQEKETRLTMQWRQTPLRQALADIETKSGIRIAFNSRLAGLDVVVDTSFTDATVEVVLKALLKGTALQYKKIRNYYFITSRNGVPGGLSGRIV